MEIGIFGAEANQVDGHSMGVSNDAFDAQHTEGKSELIFLGSGSSTGVPSPICLMQPTQPPCFVCHTAMEGPPELNKNYRCNPSLLINYLFKDGTRRYIQIDAGKNFKEQVLRWFIPYKVPRLDALILTHEHADAILGLDDIRGVQAYSNHNDMEPMPIFLTQRTMHSVHTKFPYLVKRPLLAGEEVRRVAQLDWRVIETSKFQAAGLEIMPLPVMHGEDYVSLGFLFGSRSRVAYISDVSRIPAGTEQGMTHEFHHERENAELAEWSKREGIDVQLAYDGLRISVEI